MSRDKHAPEDLELLEALRRVREGRRQDFAVVVERMQRPLYRVLMRYVDNPDDALDLVQQSLLRAFVELPRLQRLESFRPWLFRIATNLALSQLRSSARYPQLELDEAQAIDSAPDAERQLDDAQTRESLLAALDQLSPTQRAVVVLRLETELGYEDIAESVGTTEIAARVHFHHALRRLRTVLQKRGVKA